MNSKNLLLFVFIFMFTLCVKLSAQDNMAPPKPLENKVYDAMVGDWTAVSDMMGMKMKEDVSIKWALNHQYIIMDIKSVGVDNPNVKYSGICIFGVDEKGNVKAWWFDDWGAAAMSNGSGTFGENKFEMNDGNAMFKETRTFEVKGGVIIMNAKGTYTMEGKDTPFEESTTYNKK